jgi:hypothetical protein
MKVFSEVIVLRRIILLVVAFLEVIVLFGCNDQNTVVSMKNYELTEFEVNIYSDASMVIVDESVSSKGLSLEFHYYGEDEGLTGTWYTLFLFDENEWDELSYIIDENVGWNSIAFVVEKNRVSEVSIDWEWLYGELPAGRYLIVKKFLNHRGLGKNDQYYLACEFTI